MHAPSLDLPSNASDFPTADLIEPTTDGYLVLAGEIDEPVGPTFLLTSTAKRQLTARLKDIAGELVANRLATSAVVLTATLMPPGRGAYLKQRPDARIARYDLVLLARTPDVSAAQELLDTSIIRSAREMLSTGESPAYVLVGKNARRIGPVHYSSAATYLINYFLAESAARNLAVWERTAGWFEQETGLDNSELILPVEQSNACYTVVNHCRWDGLSKILPSLVLKPSFRTFVLRSFELNRTAAMPILYRLA